MATVAQNNVVKTLGHEVKHLTYPLSSGGSFDFNQGDLLWWDSSAKVVKPLTSDANAQYFVGVALKSSFLSLYTDTVSGSAKKNYAAAAEVGIGCIVSLNTFAGDTYNDGDAVYYSTDAQTVTSVAASNPVGYVKLRDGQSAITGASGVKVDVLLVAKVPVTTL